MMSNYRNANFRPQGQGGQYQTDNRRGHGFGRTRNNNQFHQGRNPREWRRGGPGGGEGSRHVENDGDVTMSDESNDTNSRRFNPYNTKNRNFIRRLQRGGGNFNRGGPKDDRDSLFAGLNNRTDKWSRVLIPYGKRISRENLMKLLRDYCPVPLVPYNQHYDGNAFIFYVKDMSVAIAIKKISGAVKSQDGFRLKAIVRVVECPQLYFNEESNGILKDCLLRRYIPQNNSLNLRSLHQDPECNGLGYVFHLKFENVMRAVSKVINEHVAHIYYLDLCANDLTSLELFNRTIDKLSNLRVLLLDSNKIARLSDLSIASGFPIEELSLKDNLLVRPRNKEQSHYIEAIRQRFPKLLRLDGQDLPPQIGFDVELPVNLPPTKDSFFVNEYGKQIAISFFERYISLYDTNRVGVVDAYHLDAVFSLVSCKVDFGRGPSNVYLTNSRNMLRVMDRERRTKLLFQGISNIMSVLNKLPKTHHDPASICLDVISSNDKFTLASICGVFKEVDNNNEYLRSFNRSFVLIPEGGGFKIINDMLLIGQAKQEQKRQSLKSSASIPTPSPSPVPSTSSAHIPDEIIKQQMVASFAQQSGMTTEWSLRCLQELHWDFNKAAQAFTDLNAKGGIPPEAFAVVDQI